jgi:hypothetical protein
MFPDNFDLLYDKNVWIFDTGASCNSPGCMDGAVNRIPVITQILGTDFRVLFLRGCISLKNWSYRPLLRDSTSPFKSACLLIRLK